MVENFDDILAENARRHARIEAERVEVPVVDRDSIDIERCRNDFRYWAANAVMIRDKLTGFDVPFVLNRAQNKVLETLERQRLNGLPMRLILLKARQWGGSTLIQMYMAWIQLMHRTCWHSAICAHVKDAARNIRGMFTALLANYPEALVETDADEGDETAKTRRGKGLSRYELESFEGAQNVRLIGGRGCRVAISSAESQDSLRGTDIALAHLSEVAFWKASSQHDPEDFLRAVCSSVPLAPYTLVAIESTANGVGNFFHTEWIRAEKGESDKIPIFVPWYLIDIYSLAVDDPRRLWETLTPYETGLWRDHGCTLEQINWYRQKRAEYPKPELMHAEFPTTAHEAFVSSDANVFANADIEALRAGCRAPREGELGGNGFVEVPGGDLSVWAEPEKGAVYVVSADVGGRSAKSDWSVVSVLKYGPQHEVVAQWRGHIDHDLLADKAIAVARWYNDALLVIESNTLETADYATSSSSVLQYVERNYYKTYRRSRSSCAGDGADSRTGFHVNHKTKAAIIDNLQKHVRERSYVERDSRACDELATYCRLPNGSYEARRGCHDDILMTRAMALHVMDTHAASLEPWPGGGYDGTCTDW